MYSYEIEKRIMLSLGESIALVEVLVDKLEDIKLPETDYQILSLIDQSNVWLDKMKDLRTDMENL